MAIDVLRLQDGIDNSLERLAALQAGDAAAERTLSRSNTWGRASMALAVLSTGLAFVLLGLGFRYALWLPVVFLASAALAYATQAIARRRDLEDRKIEAAALAVKALRADTPSKATLQIEIDFRDAVKAGRKHRTEKDRFWIFWSTRSVTWVHPWLKLRGALTDGTRYQLGLTDTVTIKEKRKRKYTKKRVRTRGTISIALRFKPGRYGDAAQLAERIKARRARRLLALRRVSGQGNRLICSLTTPDHLVTRGRYGRESVGGTENKVTGKMLLEGLLWVYDALGTSRAA